MNLQNFLDSLNKLISRSHNNDTSPKLCGVKKQIQLGRSVKELESD